MKVVVAVIVLLAGSCVCTALPAAAVGATDIAEQDGAALFNQCAQYNGCSSCRLNSGCGWCSVSNSCIAGTMSGSTNGACTTSGTDDAVDNWWFNNCPSSCDLYNDCGSCVGDSLCGWCNSTGTCMGHAMGSTPSRCSTPGAWRVGTCAAPTNNPLGFIILVAFLVLVCGGIAGGCWACKKCEQNRQGSTYGRMNNTTHGVPVTSVGTPSPYAQALQGSAANMASGQTYNPGMHPGMMQPGMQPGMMQPGMQPGMMQPGMMQPGMMQPGMQPHMMQSGAHYQGMYPNTSMAPGMAPGYTAARTISTGHAPYQAVESPRESQHSAGSGVAYTQPAMVTEREEYAPGPGEQQSEFHQPSENETF